MPRAIPIEDEIGKRYGRLTVLRFHGYRKLSIGRMKQYECVCDCGAKGVFNITPLRHRTTTSCGCFHRQQTAKINLTHGMANRSAEYRAWKAIKGRCTNQNLPEWANYGGRGILVCSRWANSFENFLKDMGPRPSSQHSINRIDNDGPYSPENCNWATYTEQARNKRCNRVLSLDDRSMTLAEWSVQLGINSSSLIERLEKWPLREALTAPKRGYGPKPVCR